MNKNTIHIYGLSDDQKIKYKGKVVIYRPGEHSEILKVFNASSEYSKWVQEHGLPEGRIEIEYVNPNEQNTCFYN